MANTAKSMLDMIRANKNKYSRSGGSVYRLKTGSNQLRIIGADDGKFWRDVGQHWIKAGLDKKPLAVIGCADITFDRPCGICMAISEAQARATDDDTLELVKSWKANKFILVNAVVRDLSDASGSKDHTEIVQLPPSVFGEVLAQIEEYFDEQGDATDAAKGFDFKIEKSGAGMNTEYKVMPKFGTKAVTKAQLEKAQDLDKFVQSEFFKDSEMKGVNAIASIIGFDPAEIRGLAAPSSPSAGLLTSRGASIAEAHEDIVDVDAIDLDDDEPQAVATPVKTKSAAAEAKAASLPSMEDDDELDAALAELDAL